MMNWILFICLLFVFSSCTHRIERSGYRAVKSDTRNCDIPIRKFMVIGDSMQKVGSIILSDTKFSTMCNEAHAIAILKNEACIVNATLINIVAEKRPDFISSCYRCKAEFYIGNGTQSTIQPDTLYTTESINKRTTKDRKNNTAMAVGAITIGLIGGFIIGFLLIQ